MSITNLKVNDDGCAVDDLAYCNAVQVTVGAEESWAQFAALAVESEWLGLEALSGLTGTVGEVVTANPVVFGAAPADTVASVRTWETATDRQRTFAFADCGFEPGRSRFSDGGFRLLDVAFLFPRADLTAPVHDPELGALLGLPPGGRAPLTAVRRAVIERSKAV